MYNVREVNNITFCLHKLSVNTVHTVLSSFVQSVPPGGNCFSFMMQFVFIFSLGKLCIFSVMHLQFEQRLSCVAFEKSYTSFIADK